MADVGSIQQRFLEPQWTTVVGTLHEWHDLGVARRRAESRGSGFALLSLGRDGATLPEAYDSVRRVWLHRDGRYRVEQLDPGGGVLAVTVSDGVRPVNVGPNGAAWADGASAPAVWVTDPAAFVGADDLRFGEQTVFAGRQVVRVDSSVRPSDRNPDRDLAWRHLSSFRGTTAQLLLDEASGLGLRFVNFFGDDVLHRDQFTDVAVDVAVADELFTYVPVADERITSPGEELLATLEARGLDVSGIDPEDTEGLMRAWASLENGGTVPVHVGPVRRRPTRELVLPIGPPPVDEETAVREIREAVESVPRSELRLGTVERGHLLVEALDSANALHAHLVTQPVRYALQETVFLRDDEALIRFSIDGGNEFPFDGRVVRRDGRWLVTFETIARILETAGVEVPSVFDDLPGD